ncbi:cupin domain-containing protein [Vannielia litorea]|uniref:cupin domain-containing protein n=1 Tax=Vannielia litorea TaxID=1217970 RepID=UPI001C95F116|nr:cupin domain-containing protein [Vannielia litorea]MBY6046981.1 cupin domain-containing protein [Vannielia litorea]MBY6074395.1 cupin domain-containing protein [Vannielia litorea]
MDAQEIIDRLGLQPHPEGGHYRQTWVEDPAQGRPAGTCIYFLLRPSERSHWHRVDATEIWHFYSGTPLTLRIAATQHGPATRRRLGPDLAHGAPQLIVPKDHWQAAEADASGWALVGCTVSPGFRFEGFTLAPPGFDIPDGS